MLRHVLYQKPSNIATSGTYSLSIYHRETLDMKTICYSDTEGIDKSLPADVVTDDEESCNFRVCLHVTENN